MILRRQDPTPMRRKTRFASRLSALVLGLGVVVTSCQSQGAGKQGRDLEALLDRALSASREGDWTRAATLWKDVFKAREGNDPESCLEAARALSELDEKEAAIEILQAGVKADPDNPDLYEAKGRLLVDLGFRRSAEQCFERALENDPERMSVLVALGRLRVELDREEAALEPLERALELGCTEPGVLALYARAQRAVGDRVVAWRVYRELIADEAAFDPAERILIQIEAAGLGTDPSVLASDPQAPSLAEAWLADVLRDEPANVAALFQRGVLLEARGLTEEAAASYASALEHQPRHLAAMTNLACLYRRTGRVARAQELLQSALEVEHDRQRRRAITNLIAACNEARAAQKAPE